MGGKWENGRGGRALGLLRGLGLNETRCVVGPRKGGSSGGEQVCESVSCSSCDLDVFGILVFGLRPGICILGVQ